MKLTTKGRYAVMAMTDLARHGSAQADAANDTATPSGGGAKPRPISLADIASRQEISLSYLEQLFAPASQGSPCHLRARTGGRVSFKPPCR
jgi:Rrf2 family iron-sulfur cluster assembly transcriptional regulator